MTNTLFPPAHMHKVGTNDSHKVPIPTVNYLEEATVPSHFKRPAWMTTTNKGGGSIPGSKNRFDGKPERFVLQVDRGT